MTVMKIKNHKSSGVFTKNIWMPVGEHNKFIRKYKINKIFNLDKDISYKHFSNINSNYRKTYKIPIGNKKSNLSQIIKKLKSI